MRFALGLLFILSVFVLLAFNVATVAPSFEEERKWIEIVSLASTILSGFFWFRCRKRKTESQGGIQK